MHLARLKPPGRIPPLASVAVLAVLVGLVVGFGLGYRFGGETPVRTPQPTIAPTIPPGDVQGDSVSPRLTIAFEAAAPGGWGVCSIDAQVACSRLVASYAEPRVPPSEYGLGWYRNLEFNRVAVSPGHLVVATYLGQGGLAAWLDVMGPGDAFLQTTRLSVVNPGRHGTFYFDLGELAAGHYVVEADFRAASSPGLSPRMTRTLVVGFVVR